MRPSRPPAAGARFKSPRHSGRPRQQGLRGPSTSSWHGPVRVKNHERPVVETVISVSFKAPLGFAVTWLETSPPFRRATLAAASRPENLIQRLLYMMMPLVRRGPPWDGLSGVCEKPTQTACEEPSQNRSLSRMQTLRTRSSPVPTVSSQLPTVCRSRGCSSGRFFRSGMTSTSDRPRCTSIVRQCTSYLLDETPPELSSTNNQVRSLA